ncbi:RNA chaperone Hfq [Vibrio parahaemolyticus]|uniref:RNA chaperone Hfq n=1 Tax=Vibrio parahaemolyticus TaxID=670 RepID=UPI0031CC8A95
MIKSEIYKITLDTLIKEAKNLNSDSFNIFLQNGIKIDGEIEQYDECAVQVKREEQSSIVNSDTINTITVNDQSLIEKLLTKLNEVENEDLFNEKFNTELCEPAIQSEMDIEMFFLNRISISGRLLRYGGDVLVIFSKIRDRKTNEIVPQLQIVVTDNVVSGSIKTEIFF